MKDSEGREYDGWVLRNRGGYFMVRSFHRLRTNTFRSSVFSIEKLRYMGIRAVKVRFVEIEEEPEASE